jgi:hypothetical protein
MQKSLCATALRKIQQSKKKLPQLSDVFDKVIGR